MAFDDDLESIHDPVLGFSPPASWGDAINENFAVIGGAWEPYAPILKGATTDATATVNSGAFLRLGKIGLLHVNLTIITPGEGAYSLTLPAGWSVVGTRQSVTGMFRDASTAKDYPMLFTESSNRLYGWETSATDAEFTSTAPVTVAVADGLSIGPGVFHLA